MQLKENGVYTLPDGREFVVRAESGGYLLHDPRRGVSSAPVYWVNETGQIIFWGKLTQWYADDLLDTGRTCLPEVKRLHLL